MLTGKIAGKTLKKRSVLIGLILIATIGYGQENNCLARVSETGGEDMGDVPFTTVPYEALDPIIVDDIFVKVRTHVVSGDDQVTESAIANAYTDAQAHFDNNNSRIHLIILPEVHVITDSEYQIIDDADEALEMMETHSSEDVLDVFFVNQLWEGQNGIAQWIRTSALTIDDFATQIGEVLVHEMGHCFGLYHTYHATYENECAGDAPFDCARENVEREGNNCNCTVAGDYLCGTPADYRVTRTHISEDCEYVDSGEQDDFDQPYLPDVTNIMAKTRIEYGYDIGCRTTFSWDQIRVMHCVIKALGLNVTPGIINFANRPFGSTIDHYSESTLDIVNHDNLDYTFLDHPSDSAAVVITEDSYTVQTNDYELSNDGVTKRHHSWSIDPEYFKIRITDFPMVPDGEVTAWYKEREQVSVTQPEIIDFRDPWYIQNPGADPDNWIQPNSFRPLSELAPSDTYKVFLNQELDQGAHYSLRAPRHYADENGIYQFSHWSVTNQTEGPGAGQPAADFGDHLSRTTAVVFKEANAQITVNYDLNNPLNLQAGAEIRIQMDDVLAIPPGSTIEFAEGTQLVFESSDEFGGTETDPITLQGVSGVRWDGIELASDFLLKNMILKNTTIGIEITGTDLDTELDQITIDDTEIGIVKSADSYGGELVCTNVSVSNPNMYGFRVYATEIGYIQLENCLFNNPTQTDLTAIRVKPGTESFFDLAETFDLISIVNNEISGFSHGIDVQLASDLEGDTYNWADGPDRVIIKNNVVKGDGAIGSIGVSTWGHTPFLIHHNIVYHFETGINVAHGLSYMDDIDDFFYKIYHNTIAENQVGFNESSIETGTPDFPNIALAGNIFYNQSQYSAVFENDVKYNVWSGSNEFYGWNLFHSEVSGYASHIDTYYPNPPTNYCLIDNPQFVDPNNHDYRLRITSPAFDHGYEDFDEDGTDYTTDIDDQDPDGSRMDIGALYYPVPPAITSPLTITEDTEWFGTYQIDADVTVASGATLTILPGSHLNFSYVKGNESILTVNGDLIADGLPDAPIIFTSSETTPSKGDWYAIKLNSTVNDNATIIDNCIIEYAKYGIQLYGASPDISNNTIRYNTYGIQSRSGSSPDITSNVFEYNNYGTYSNVSSPVYTNNLIENNSTRGMYHYGTSTPRMYHNTVRDNSGIGVYMYNRADVQFGHLGADEKGWNEIVDNSSYGIYANYYCDPFLGTTDPYNQPIAGYNSIHDNGTYNLRTYRYSTAEAEHNWWEGETTWSAYYLSTYDVTPVLTSAPDPASLGSSLAKTGSYDGYAECPDYDFYSPDTLSECAMWYWAHDLRVTDQLNVALWAWQYLVEHYPESEYAELALSKVVTYTALENHAELNDNLYSVLDNSEYPDDLRITSLELLIGLNMISGEYENAYTCALSLLDQAESDYQELIALFTLIDLNQYSLGKSTAARGFLNQMKEQHPNNELTLMAAELMGEEVDWSLVDFGHESEEQKEYVLPTMYALYAAYPNPFNPVTTIRYDLPEDARVELNVFDITGRLVATLVNNQQVGGQYAVQWHGRSESGDSLPSGLYIYQLQAGGFTANQKMLLLK